MWPYSWSTSTESSIRMALKLPWRTWRLSIHRLLCRVTGYHSALDSSATHGWILIISTSAKHISVQAEWLRHSGRALSKPSETPRWRITLRQVSIPRVALHIAHQSPFHHFFSPCRSPILNKHSGVVANCDHTSEWVHCVDTCIRIAMQWVTLRISLRRFLLHWARRA